MLYDVRAHEIRFCDQRTALDVVAETTRRDEDDTRVLCRRDDGSGAFLTRWVAFLGGGGRGLASPVSAPRTALTLGWGKLRLPAPRTALTRLPICCSMRALDLPSGSQGGRKVRNQSSEEEHQLWVRHYYRGGKTPATPR